MLEQKCGCSPDHQENIIGICLSDKCVNNAIFCYLCLKQFHSEHQQQCQTFKILYNQLILEQNELQIYVNYVKEFKVIFDEIYKKQLEKNQENIEKLNSINLRMKDKSYYPTYSDIHFLKSNKASLQNFKQWISRLEWIEKQVYNQNDYNDHDQNDDRTETLKVDTEQDQTDNQTIDPQSVEIDLKKCEELIQLKEYSLAIQNMQKGIELNPQGAIQLIQQNINLINSQNLSQLEASNLRDIIHQAKKIIDENQSLEETNNLSDDKKQEKQNEIIEIEKTFLSYLVELNQIISDYQDGKYQKEIEQKIHQQLYQNQIYQGNISTDKTQISILFQEGDVLFTQQHYEEAIKIFNKIIDIDSKNSTAYRNKGIEAKILAQCLNLLERHEEAMEYSSLAIQIDPENFESYLIRGISQLKLNLYQEAIDSFQTVLNLDNNQHTAYALKGQALHHLKRFKEAITQFDLALFIYQDVSYLIKKADSLFELQEYQDAVTAYEDALLAGADDVHYIYEKLKSIQIN